MTSRNQRKGKHGICTLAHVADCFEKCFSFLRRMKPRNKYLHITNEKEKKSFKTYLTKKSADTI